MKTVELFAGIGGFRLAADSMGFKTIWANDIEPKACKVYKSCFGNRELVEGDIRNLKTQIPSHDLLTAGFPCQPFSSAGMKKGIRDPRGTLFQEIVDVLKLNTPDFFILENVKRLLTMEDGLHFATILSSLTDLNYTIEWRLFNAMDFGLPQNRQRVFIVGTKADDYNINGNSSLSIVSTKLAIESELNSLKPIDLEDLSDSKSWKFIEKHGKKFPNWGIASNHRFWGKDLNGFDSKSKPVFLNSILQDNVSSEFDFTESTLSRLHKNTPVNKMVQGVEIISNQGGGARMGYTIFGVNGVAPTLTSTASRHYERYLVGNKYRRLTNIEYARIQGFPDNHCEAVSVYDQYSLIGNAVPAPIVKWVMSRLNFKVLRKSIPRAKRQGVLLHYGT
ncbi:DNA (cytosine-5-)-methyltransferase [bacterium]|nr:MAG: DNA (cytosine-5-)-methyltransferase [bacterium]